MQKQACVGGVLARPTKGKDPSIYMPQLSVRIKWMDYLMGRKMLTDVQRHAWFDHTCTHIR